MAKDKERKLAKVLFVEQGKSAKQVAELVNVSEATMSKWVNDSGWMAERSARNANPSKQLANLQQIIFGISEERIQLTKELREAEANEDNRQIYKRIGCYTIVEG